jgi:hypothetical protein
VGRPKTTRICHHLSPSQNIQQQCPYPSELCLEAVPMAPRPLTSVRVLPCLAFSKAAANTVQCSEDGWDDGWLYVTNALRTCYRHFLTTNTAVGLIIGFIFGFTNILRFGPGPNGMLRTLGQYMMGSAATFGYALLSYLREYTRLMLACTASSWLLEQQSEQTALLWPPRPGQRRTGGR